MHNLAFYYKHKEKNYDLMKQYYLMAIEQNNNDSMNGLAHYYEHTEKNYGLMKKYYLMAIKHNDKYATNNLMNYYGSNMKNYINDAIYFYGLVDKLKEKYRAIKKAFTHNYIIDYYMIMDYVESNKISMLLLKYNNICISTKKIMFNHKRIILLLHIIKNSHVVIPMYIKFNIMVLFIMQ